MVQSFRVAVHAFEHPFCCGGCALLSPFQCANPLFYSWLSFRGVALQFLVVKRTFAVPLGFQPTGCLCRDAFLVDMRTRSLSVYLSCCVRRDPGVISYFCLPQQPQVRCLGNFAMLSDDEVPPNRVGAASWPPSRPVRQHPRCVLRVKIFYHVAKFL